MPTVHVIHDWDRKDRFELLCQEIAQQNLSVVIWDACKGQGKPKVQINRCHKQIVQYFKDNNYEEGIIMEDDCHFTHPNSFKYFMDNKPTDFDLYLGGVIWGSIGIDNTIQDYAGNQFFIIHKRYYDTFLESDPNRDIDRAQARRGLFKVCNPFIVIQHETFSDNMKRIHHNFKLYKNRKLYDGTNG